MTRRQAFTFVELLVAVVVLAILTLAVLPEADAEVKEQGKNAALRFEADVFYARSASVARSDDPIVIKMDQANQRYWLARQSDPSTAITHPQSGAPYVVQLGPTSDAGFDRVLIHGFDFGGDDELRFDGTGATDQDAAAVVQFKSGTADYEVGVYSASADTTISNKFLRDLTAQPGGT
jgi:prepilin-type N-terminal cleavage/methylation domain-containing protein